MNPNSRHVGTQDRFEERAYETFMRELGRNTDAPRRSLFQDAQQCCFITQTGTRCKRAAAEHHTLCTQHVSMCYDYLREYQHACKPNDQRARELWEGAKDLIQTFFPGMTKHDAQNEMRRMIVSVQNDFPVQTSHSTPLSLNLFDSLVHPLQNAYRSMPPAQRADVEALVRLMYDEWRA